MAQHLDNITLVRTKFHSNSLLYFLLSINDSLKGALNLH